MLGDQSDQRDDADLAVNVPGPAGGPQREERARHRQRHREQDHQGIGETLELRRQHEKDEDERQRERQINAAARVAELARHAVQIGQCARRQHTARGVVHHLQRVTERIAGRQRGRDFDRAQTLKVIERLRRYPFLNAHDVGQLHHRAVARAHVDVADVVRTRAIARRDLHDHVVLLAVLLEACDLVAAQHRLQGAADRLHRYAQVGQLVAVESNPQFGRVQSQIRLRRLHDSGPVDLGDVLRDHPIEVGIGHLRHDHEVHRQLARRLPEPRWIDGEPDHPRQALEFLIQLARDVLLLAGAIFPRLEAQDRVAEVHGRETGDRVVRRGLRNRCVVFLDRAQLLRGVVDRGAGRGLQAPVFDRRQL